MPELAYLNGEFSPIAEAKVSVEDRGFQLGDGVYEVIAAYNERPFLLQEHLARLRRSAAAIRLPYNFDKMPLEPVIAEGLARSNLGDTTVYIQLTRGAAPRAHAIPSGIPPTVVVTFRPIPVLEEAQRLKGARVMTALDARWSNCYIKATSLLPNILVRDDAIRKGYDDAIFITDEGEVRECTAANLFMGKNGQLTIPPRTDAILHGVTQGFLLECAAAIELTVNEESFHVDALRKADEVFMSSTTLEVMPITSIDDQLIADGKVGTITQRLHEEFRKSVQSLTAKE